MAQIMLVIKCKHKPDFIYMSHIKQIKLPLDSHYLATCGCLLI